MSEIQKHKDLVYDVGLHKGEDTDYYVKKGFRVIAFEADPDLAEQCRTRFQKEIENGKLTIVEGAIVDSSLEKAQDKVVKFYKNRDNSVWGTVAHDWAHRNEDLGTSNEIIEVPAVSFPDCLKKYGIPHYLKIDIEGMDAVCLEALTQFEEKPDYLSIESEKVSFSKLTEEIDLLTELGYNKFQAIQQVGVSHQKEPNPSKEGVYVGYKFHEGSSGLFGKDLASKWKDSKQILDQYKYIFLQYRLFGDYGILTRTRIGKIFTNTLRKVLRKPLPGWRDTHAKHSSADT